MSSHPIPDYVKEALRAHVAQERIGVVATTRMALDRLSTSYESGVGIPGLPRGEATELALGFAKARLVDHLSIQEMEDLPREAVRGVMMAGLVEEPGGLARYVERDDRTGRASALWSDLARKPWMTDLAGAVRLDTVVRAHSTYSDPVAWAFALRAWRSGWTSDDAEPHLFRFALPHDAMLVYDVLETTATTDEGVSIVPRDVILTEFVGDWIRERTFF